MWSTILSLIIESLAKIGISWKTSSEEQKKKALEQTVESVEKSLEVEREIREKQQVVDQSPSTVKDSEGGLNFDTFNKRTSESKKN